MGPLLGCWLSTGDCPRLASKTRERSAPRCLSRAKLRHQPSPRSPVHFLQTTLEAPLVRLLVALRFLPCCRYPPLRLNPQAILPAAPGVPHGSGAAAPSRGERADRACGEDRHPFAAEC